MRSRSALTTFLVTAVVAIGPAGCGRDQGLPDACLSSPSVILTALEAAPGPARLQGTPISACLDQNGEAGVAQNVGANLVQTASELATRVSDDHDSAAATQLGYLIGAVRKGAGNPPTLQAELVRRLELEADRIDTDSPSYTRGEQAGEASG